MATTNWWTRAGLVIVGVALVWRWVDSASATSTQPEPPRNARMAFVDVFSISEQVMQSAETNAAIETVAAGWREKLTPIQEDLQKLGGQLQTLPENDPAFEKLLQEGREKEAQGRQLEAQANDDVEATKAKLLIQAYERTVTAAERVAAAKGYTHVMASRSARRPIETPSVNIALQEMLARTMLVGPSEDDLTAEVAKALGITLGAAPGTPIVPQQAEPPLPVKPK